jgi:nitrogen fixation protein NifU and related proteins
MYEQVILDHNKNPRNYGPMDAPDRVVDGFNPLCGDTLKVYLKFDGDMITEVKFEGHGCAISKSSASLMTASVVGKTRAEAQALFDAFHHMLKSDHTAPVDEAALGKLRVFSGVREFPVRVKCATLPWHALASALTEEVQEVVTTE